MFRGSIVWSVELILGKMLNLDVLGEPYFTSSSVEFESFNNQNNLIFLVDAFEWISLCFVDLGSLTMSTIQRPIRHSVVCEAAPKKKADSAAKRACQAEKRRIYNKSRKSEIKTRMKKVSLLLSCVWYWFYWPIHSFF